MLAALAPTVSQALVASGVMDSGWVEVCTAQGTRWVALGDDASTEAPVEHCAGVCAYCFTHAGSFGLVPALEGSQDSRDEYVARLAVQPSLTVVLSNVWSPHQTRAPPQSA